ncbi:MAG: S8 family peptidase [Fibrobacterota bacterium]|nr:S8 family peptidase [Fibrobacterota bacterium]
MPKKAESSGRSRSTASSPKTIKPRVAAPMGGNPNRTGFNPGILDSNIIALPLLRQIQEEESERKALKGAKAKAIRPASHDVIIDVNMDFPGGRHEARKRVAQRLERILSTKKADKDANRIRPNKSEQYIFASLQAEVIRLLVSGDRYSKDGNGHLVEAQPPPSGLKEVKEQIDRSIYKVWPDFKVRAFMDRSVRTVKADAARFSFSAEGKGMVWAVMDSGIQGDHVHFQKHQTLDTKGDDILHRDFTGGNDPLKDEFGHGTHVAGIIAGEVKGGNHCSFVKQRDENGEITYLKHVLDKISGMAPQCKLVSLKVLDGEGGGQVSNLIAALDYVQEANANGRRLRIHGVNMSLGYDFDPEWFACGQSPLCVEVDRMVRSGVVVVVAAGNTGYAYVNDAFKGPVASGMDLSINDPGNSDLAITVGSTHKDSPHIYGVSYFSSKGPTGDGRLKPDLVAPGEKILSCAAGKPREEIKAETGADCDYREHSGTSMAAPHVSGVVAAFLSVRREFIGQPGKVKEIFLNTATDLKREKYFQGHGLVDLMRAIQSV